MTEKQTIEKNKLQAKYATEFARAGGKANVKKMGKAHMKKIGKKGAKARWGSRSKTNKSKN